MNQILDSAEEPLVLAADADVEHRKVLKAALETAGLRVATTETGKETFELFEELQPDAVLLDVELPDFDGFRVCEQIREEETNRETPIFIVTGRDDLKAVQRAYSVGATDFLNKPIAFQVLPHRIRCVIKTSRSLNDLRGLIRAVPDLIFIVNSDGEV